MNDDRHHSGFRAASSLARNGGYSQDPMDVDHHHSWLDIDEPEDRPLDAFDQELLASQAVSERQRQASQGLARMSLPSRAPNPSTNSVTAHQYQMREEIPASPRHTAPTFSSPSTLVSSPTTVVLRNRQMQQQRAQNQSSVGISGLSPPKPAARSHGNYGPTHSLALAHAPPMVQGITLVCRNELPDRLRSVFPFPLYNAVQSKCFPIAYQSDDNLVLSAPTGSGKTVVMELAICRLLRDTRATDFKIVYQAPTKALCSERCKDWQAKFKTLNLHTAELTGDTDVSEMRNAQSADIIVTTPEKWDSITRRWKDHVKLMKMVKLFLIDEVHILKESRGATLEAVVSRMKSVGSDVRFIALSATVPNADDVATWLGRDPLNTDLSARCEVFGEEFRPVQLTKHVYGHPLRGNDFVLDKVLEQKLPEVIAKHSKRKPIIIFCPFRKSCSKTAKTLAQLWMSTVAGQQLWSGPSRPLNIIDNELRQLIPAGVAFHHAGLDLADRRAIEQGFLNGDISIICCTSTLAVGVNLPCYLVIIKGTVSWTESGLKDYADLEMMQMLGRAGRPQFEQSACAVILTRDERVDHYNRLVSGHEPLESSLHLNLIDHLNAEVGLGTVSDLDSAKKWLGSTFLFVRLGRNPNRYRIEDMSSKRSADILDEICAKNIGLLQEVDLVSEETPFKCTAYGDAMARYCVKFETMRHIMSLPPRAKLSEILSVVAQASEFRDVRLKSGEKSLFKHINKDVAIKFPIKVDLALSAHKVSLLIQAELGGLDFPVGEPFAKHKGQFQQDKTMVLTHLNRLIRCIVDCQITREDSISACHALELARSFAARVWDNSPLQLKQLDQIGNVAMRKLANASINTLEALESTEARRLEMIIGKAPPFGMKLLSRVAQMPRLRVSIEMVGKEMKPHEFVKIRLRAEIAFLNDKLPSYFRKKQVFVCFLAETSDGQLADFRRFPAKKLEKGQQICFEAELTKPSQYLLAHVMCDEIAGTCRSVELHLNIPKSLFATLLEKQASEREPSKDVSRGDERKGKRKQSDEFDDGIADEDLLAAEQFDLVEFVDANDFDREVEALASSKPSSGTQGKKRLKSLAATDAAEPRQLENGKWACSHKCKDKSGCKHPCCQNGLDKPPKPSRQAAVEKTKPEVSQLSLVDTIKRSSSSYATGSTERNTSSPKPQSATNMKGKHQSQLNMVGSPKGLARLHNSTTPLQSSARFTTSHKAGSSSTLREAAPVQDRVVERMSRETFARSDTTRNEWPDDIGPEDVDDLAEERGFVSINAAAKQPSYKPTLQASKGTADEDLEDFFGGGLDSIDEDDEMAGQTRPSDSVGEMTSTKKILDGSQRLEKQTSGASSLAMSIPKLPPVSQLPSRKENTKSNAFDLSDVSDGYEPDWLDDIDFGLDDLTRKPKPTSNNPKPLRDQDTTSSTDKNLFFASPRKAISGPAPTGPEPRNEHLREREQEQGDPTRWNVIDHAGREWKPARQASGLSQKENLPPPPPGGKNSTGTERDEGIASMDDDGDGDGGLDPEFYDEFKDFVEFI